MDSVIGLDFKNELPLVMTKTIASSITKTVTEQLSAQAAGQAGGDFAKLFVQLGGAIYNASVNIADERTWTTLPKEFQFCRLPTPSDRKLDISIPNGFPQTVTLNDSAINVVYVKSIGPATPLIVSQFKLNGAPIATAPAPTAAPIANAAPAESAPMVTTTLGSAPTPAPAENSSNTNQTVEASASAQTASASDTTVAPAEPMTNASAPTETVNAAADNTNVIAAVEPAVMVAETNVPPATEGVK
jgi:hypothetical protein